MGCRRSAKTQKTAEWPFVLIQRQISMIGTEGTIFADRGEESKVRPLMGAAGLSTPERFNFEFFSEGKISIHTIFDPLQILPV